MEHIEEEYKCWECKDRKLVDIGEFDDVVTIRCPFCNEKEVSPEDLIEH